MAPSHAQMVFLLGSVFMELEHDAAEAMAELDYVVGHVADASADAAERLKQETLLLTAVNLLY